MPLKQVIPGIKILVLFFEESHVTNNLNTMLVNNGVLGEKIFTQ
jgi:hypothetical protein